MPELPEVETMCRGLHSLVGLQIESAVCPAIEVKPCGMYPTKATLLRRLKGSEILAIERRGKRVVLRLDCGYLVFQPKMTGLVCLTDPPDPGHVRLILKIRSAAGANQRAGVAPERVYFWDRRGLGTIALWTSDELETHLGPDVLGTDALEIKAGELQERAGRSKRPIKVVLLDQKVVAGVGNLYASEILHRIGLDPRQGADSLTSSQWQMLHAAMLDILQTAIRYEGSTLGDGTYRNALNQDGSYQNHHQVYDREGELCLTCGRGTILRIVQAQRATFFCTECQR
jgi:formamidopyrimidine-DNA glycosylase